VEVGEQLISILVRRYGGYGKGRKGYGMGHVGTRM